MQRFNGVACLLAVAGLVAGGCAGGAEGITADTTCEDYIKRPSNERHDAAVRISAQTAGVSSPGNPMWGLSLDAACGGHPSMTVGAYFDPDR